MTLMDFESASRLIMAPPDPYARQRAARLRQLGLGRGQPQDPHFDEFARRVAQTAGAPIAMVNFIDEESQYFAGMFTQPAPQDIQVTTETATTEQDRAVGREHGFCPHVLVRRKALVLEDVCDYPRFASDQVVDEAGVRSYMASPLIDRTGMAIGTVCVADVDINRWGRRGLNIIKTMAGEVLEYIHQREGVVA